MSTLGPDSAHARQQPEETGERRLTGWQHTVRWILWLAFLAAVVYKSGATLSALEWLTFIAAVGFTIWCTAKPLGGPKAELTQPSGLLGTFESRTNWGLLLFGAVLTVGGVGATGAAIYDVSTGRATVGDVLHDIAIFIEGWFVEVFTKGFYDAELEKTHAYALFLLLIPGVLLLLINSTPVFNRGSQFRVEADGSVMVQRNDSWEPLLEYQYPSVTADGTTIAFTPGQDGPPAVKLPQARVFCRENGARLKAKLSAEFFTALLSRRGFHVDAAGSSGFTARRK